MKLTSCLAATVLLLVDSGHSAHISDDESRHRRELQSDCPTCPLNPCVFGATGTDLYFPHCDKESNKYIQCDAFGRCYERPCAPGTVWDQDALTCVFDTDTGPTSTIDLGNGNSVTLEVITETASEIIVTTEDAGTLTLTPSNVNYQGPEGTKATFDIPLPETTKFTADGALAVSEFVLLQLSAAADATSLEPAGRRRRLDSPGCDLFPDAPCNLFCCAVHDRCYAENGCDATSWARTACQPLAVASLLPGNLILGALGTIFCTAALFFVSGECNQCNNVAVACIAAGCSGIIDTSSSELCYDNQCDEFIECPGTCPFISLDDFACCGCVTPGANCGSPASCGNGVCNFAESTSNCFVDCAFNNCPGAGEFDCSGSCVNPKTDPNNCGACGLKCPGGSPCVLGSCSTPFSVTWSTTAFGVIGSGGWIITNDGLSIRFAIEDSENCGGPNGIVQGGTASATIAVSETFELQAIIDGISELQDSGFENMDVTLDGLPIVAATSTDSGLGCAMGPSIINFLVPQPIVITPGNHVFEINFSTGDPLFHVGAYYELNLILVPTAP